MTIRMTYAQFREFVRKHEDERGRFKKRWFKLNIHTGVVYISETEPGKNEHDWVWIYNGYFPIYDTLNNVMIGLGDFDGTIRYPLSSTKTPVKLDDVEMVILTDVYGNLDQGD